MARIHQMIGKDFYKYETADDGVRVEVQSGQYYRAHKIPYEQIGFDEIVTGRSVTATLKALYVSLAVNYVLLILALLFTFDFGPRTLTLVTVATSVIVAAVALNWKRLYRVRRHKTLEGEEDLHFYYEGEGTQTVDAFVQQLRDCKKRYVYGKYLKFDNLLPLEDQKAKVDFLFEDEQIERRVYQVYVEEYERRLLIRGN